MFPTMEVRWFYEGTVPSEILEWFYRGEQKPEEPLSRVDYYLRLADGDSLGVKLREGRIELKQRHHQYGAVRFHQRVSGQVEQWHKWSFALAEADSILTTIKIPASSGSVQDFGKTGGHGGDTPESSLVHPKFWDAPASSWIGVKKERRQRQYRLTGDKKIVALPAGIFPEQGCSVEVTNVSVAGKNWWSLGFEAFGGEANIQENLLLATKHVLAKGEPPVLEARVSYGYPKWLELAAPE